MSEAAWVPDHLFRPLDLCGMQLPNRIVMSPMTREFAPDGLLVDEAEDYYARRAAGGASLLITEGTTIPHPVAHHNANVPHFYGQAALARWQSVVTAVHAVGGRIFPQLWHCGIGRYPAESPNPDALSIGPSVVGKQPMRSMDQSDIDAVVEAFATAAADAQRIGFDGVAIHGAHGYLVDAFFWHRTNRREDGYGGDIAERARFGAEIVAAIRARVGPDFPIMFRFSQWKGLAYDAKVAETPQQLEAWLAPLVDAGVDIFDASTRRFWTPEFEGSPLNLAGWAKKLTGKTSMTVGSVGLEGPLDGIRVDLMSRMGVSIENLRVLDAMMAKDEVDLVAIGRSLLANPDWPRLVHDGAFDRIRPYDPAATAKALEPSSVA